MWCKCKTTHLLTIAPFELSRPELLDPYNVISFSVDDIPVFYHLGRDAHGRQGKYILLSAWFKIYLGDYVINTLIEAKGDIN